jgi:hypothetical protein
MYAIQSSASASRRHRGPGTHTRFPDTYIAEWNATDHKLSNIQRLTLSPFKDFPHAWTADSRAVIYESDRLGSYSIYRQELGQNTARLIVHDRSANSLVPQVTPDGRWILYASVRSGGAAGVRHLMRVPIMGGKPNQVPIGGALDEFRCPLAATHGCVLRETNGDREFSFYALDPVTGKGSELARRRCVPSVLGDWDISPDGCVLAMPSHDPSDTPISLVPLRWNSCSGPAREVVLHNVGILWSTIWSADGKGLFVATADWKQASVAGRFGNPEDERAPLRTPISRAMLTCSAGREGASPGPCRRATVSTLRFGKQLLIRISGV